MKSLIPLFGIAIIIWLGVYSVIGMWTFLVILIAALLALGLFYKLLDKK